MADFQKFSALAVLTILLTSLTSAAHSEPLFFDSFESSDMSATNQDGFAWGSNNRTSVVTSEAAVYNNGEIYNIPNGTVDWSPFHGDHSLRFRYAAGNPMAEQRFSLGKEHKEIWFRYWVRVPTNYTHGKQSPSNHKFFALWMDAYEGDGEGSSVFWNFWGDADGGSSITVTYTEGNFSGSRGQAQSTKFIRVPEDRGRWMQVVIHIKASSSVGVSDGSLQLYRRWEQDSNFEKLHDVQNAYLLVPGGGVDGFKQGYLMGWANAPYSEDTEWLIDSFTISTESLLVADQTPADSYAPNPPALEVK
tara:strand:- start:22810 stop:23724 length:915 start_codon:yes stop_codon:yes gene_type:complete